MKNWIKYIDSNDDIVLSSRIRLARNIKDKVFPHKIDEKGAREIIDKIDEIFRNSVKTEDFHTYKLWELDPLESKRYVEKHLISDKLIVNRDKGAFIVNQDETISVMINEEDHIRIQCITSGTDLQDAYNYANKIDNILEETHEFAFDEKLGYLTVCPTNLGTGLRASIMIHLPALTMNNKINRVLNVLTQVGMTIRGLFGEGSRIAGNIYQISNQVSLGLNENEVITNLKGVVNKIITQEKLEREKLMDNYKYELEDRVYRSLGILKNAILLESVECLNLLSDVRLGIEMGIIADVNKNEINELIVDIQPAMLQKIYNKDLSKKQINLIRAKLIREKLNCI